MTGFGALQRDSVVTGDFFFTADGQSIQTPLPLFLPSFFLSPVLMNEHRGYVTKC